MKDKLGRKQSPLQALVAGEFKNDEEKRALLELLGTQEKLKGEELVPLLAHGDTAIQSRAQMLFLARASREAIGMLVEAALADAATTSTLAKVLAQVKADIVKAALDAALKEAQPPRAQAALELAMELPQEASDPYADRAFKEGSPRARFEALRRILARPAPADAMPTLLKAVEDRERRVRRAAVDALVKREGKDVFEALLERMRDDDAQIREIAAAYLQKFVTTAPTELRPTIIGRLLLAGDAELRAKLVSGLFGGPQAGELLYEMLTFAKTVLGAQHAALLDALKTLGDAITPHAVRLVEHKDPDVRVQATLVLERLDPAKAAGAAVKLTGDADWWVRIMACETLGRLKDARTLAPLERLLTDPDCKWAAIDAMASIGGESAFATLLGLLREPQAEVRLAAMVAVARLEDRRTDGYLEQLSKSDPSMDVRVRAVDLLRARRGSSGQDTAVTHGQLTRPMEKLLAFARESGASDLHITPNEPPFMRVNGILTRVDMKALARPQVDALIEELLDPVRRPVLDAKGSVDFCYVLAGVGRYRVNVFHQMRGTAAAIRVIPSTTPTLVSLGLPKSLEEIGTYHQGLVLIAGAAGCGKSTTLTALVNVLNETRQTHVLTLEDPIEFLHLPKKALINQRQVGRDTRSFAAAMRGALREDPDVIVVGELRDRETVRLAMTAAETGHLVIATLQTTGAIATVDKIVESFPTDEQQQIRVQLAGSLKLIVSQMLVPAATGNTRVAAYEILKGTSPVRALIREGKTFQIASAMQMSRAQAMITLDGALEELLAKGLITHETALSFARRKETFAKKPETAPHAHAPVAAAPAAVPAAAPRAPVLVIDATPAHAPTPIAIAIEPTRHAPAAIVVPHAPEPRKSKPPPAAHGGNTSTPRRNSRPPSTDTRAAAAPRNSRPPSGDTRGATAPRNSRPPGRPSRRIPAQTIPKHDPLPTAPSAAPSPSPNPSPAAPVQPLANVKKKPIIPRDE